MTRNSFAIAHSKRYVSGCEKGDQGRPAGCGGCNADFRVYRLCNQFLLVTNRTKHNWSKFVVDQTYQPSNNFPSARHVDPRHSPYHNHSNQGSSRGRWHQTMTSFDLKLKDSPGLPNSREDYDKSHGSGKTRKFVAFAILLAYFLSLLPWGNTVGHALGWLELKSSDVDTFLKSITISQNAVCAQVEPKGPVEHRELFRELDEIFRTDDFRLHAYESLGGAVRNPYVKFHTVYGQKPYPLTEPKRKMKKSLLVMTQHSGSHSRNFTHTWRIASLLCVCRFGSPCLGSDFRLFVHFRVQALEPHSL